MGKALKNEMKKVFVPFILAASWLSLATSMNVVLSSRHGESEKNSKQLDCMHKHIKTQVK